MEFVLRALPSPTRPVFSGRYSTTVRSAQLDYCMEHLAATSRPLRTRSPVRLPVSSEAAAVVAVDDPDDWPRVRLTCCRVSRSVRMLGRRALTATAPHASLSRRLRDTIRCRIDRGLFPLGTGDPWVLAELAPDVVEASSPGTARCVVCWILRCWDGLISVGSFANMNSLTNICRAICIQQFSKP